MEDSWTILQKLTISYRLNRLCENRKTKLFNTALLLHQAGVFHLPAYVRRRAGGKHQHEANDTFLKNYSIKFVFTQAVKICILQLFYCEPKNFLKNHSIDKNPTIRKKSHLRFKISVSSLLEKEIGTIFSFSCRAFIKSEN